MGAVDLDSCAKQRANAGKQAAASSARPLPAR